MRQGVVRNAGMALGGASLSLGFAPFGFWPVVPVAFALLIYLCSDGDWKTTFQRAYIFGLGMFGAGVSWISESFQFNNLHGPIVPLLTLSFVAFLALFPASWGALLAVSRGRLGKRATILVLGPVLWVLLEWCRGWFLTGFTWLQFGYATTDTPAVTLASIVGVYGLSLLVAMSGGALCLALLERNRFGVGVVVTVAFIWALSALVKPLDWTYPVGAQVKVALIQGNYPQDIKWLPENFGTTLATYSALTERHSDARIVVWPETSIPQVAIRVKTFTHAMHEWAEDNGSTLLMGVVSRDNSTGAYYNSMIVAGVEQGVYHKRHLVPFGEYVPIRAIFAPIMSALGVALPSFTPFPREQFPIGNGDLRYGISICYEAAFGNEVARRVPRATLLVNVSNDAWFGDTLAPHQHLEITRMRAIETGRYLLRATNTGITAVVDPMGKVVARSPQFQRSTLTAMVQPRTGVTPYVRWGDTPPIVLAFALLTFCIAAGRWKRVARD